MDIFTKNNKNLTDGAQIDIIPMMDFTQSWDDAKLYKHFGIDKTTQEYITNYLPDYYNLRGQDEI